MGLPQDFTSSPLGGSQLFFQVQVETRQQLFSVMWMQRCTAGRFLEEKVHFGQFVFGSLDLNLLKVYRRHMRFTVYVSGSDQHLMSLLSRRNTWYINNSSGIVLSYKLAKTWVENKLSSSWQSQTHPGQTTTEGTAVGCGRMHFSYLWALWWWKRKRCNQPNSSLEREKRMRGKTYRDWWHNAEITTQRLLKETEIT